MAVVAVTRPDLDDDEYRGQLWAVPTDGSAPARPLTSGHRDTAPAFSPDGRWLAYLSAEPGGRPQVWVLPTAGGAARRLPTITSVPGAPVWSPDSRRLAYAARVPEQGRYGTVEGVGAGAEPPRLITTLQYRRDAVGFLADRPARSSCWTCPPTSPTTPVPAGAGPGDDGRRRLRRRHLASGRRGTGVRLRAARAGRPRPGARRLRDRARRDRAAAGHRGAGRLRAALLRPGRARRSTSRPCPTWVPTASTSSPGRPCRAGSTRRRCARAAARPRGAPRRGRDAGDGRPPTAASWSGWSAGSGGAAPRALDGAVPETLVDGPFTVRASPPAGGVVVAVGRARPVRG